MTASPRLGFTYLEDDETVPSEAVNEIVELLECASGHFILEDRNLNTPPGSPTAGQTYLIGGSPTGAWASNANDIAYRLNTGWLFIDVIEGFSFWVKDENVFTIALTSTTFQDYAANPTESIIIACGDESTAATTGNGKVTFRMPYAFTLTAVRASATLAPTGANFIIDINEGGSTILSTKLSIDATEKTSTTAATPAVISDASLADDAEITIDFDQVGSTIAGAGVKVVLIGHR